MLRRIKREAKAQTDHDLLDDVAADGTTYAATREKKAQEAEEGKRRAMLQRQATQAQLKKIKSEAKAKTDDDIMDEAAGMDRGKAAAASKARREAEEKKRREQNKEMQERIKNTTSKTDDDISDDPAGAARGEAPKKKSFFGWG